jgi:hypothetical protein
MNRYIVVLLVALFIGAVSYTRSGDTVCMSGPTGATGTVGTVGSNGDKPCFRSGCNGEICTDREGVVSPCVWNECRHGCYNNHTTCKRIAGRCTFEEHSGFEDCISKCKN